MGLDAIVTDLAAQNPSPELALILKRKKRIERMGVLALGVSGVIGLSMLLTVAIFFKLAILGPELMFGSAIAALIVFLLASISLLTYSRYFMTAGGRGTAFMTARTFRLLPASF